MLRSPRASSDGAARRAGAGRRAARGLGAGLVVLALGAWGCGPGGDVAGGGAPRTTGGPRNLLIVTLDTTRADALSCYGFPVQTTPVIDGLAARGVRFDAAYAPMSMTLPSHASLFTGQPPRVHGALDNRRALDDGVRTLAQELSTRGYDTAAFTAARVLDESTGIERGFRTFDPPDSTRHDAERPADEVTDRALAWAQGRPDDAPPALLWVHYFDPHGPYEPASILLPRGPVEDAVAAAHVVPGKPPSFIADLWYDYLNEIANVDRQLGRLLDGLRANGFLEDAVLLVVGDHGEGFYEHGDNSHGLQVTEEHVRVPAVLVLPGDELAGTVVDETVLLRDMGPTLLAFARAGAPWSVEGRDLSPALRGERALAPRPVFLERPHYDKDRFEERFGARGLTWGTMVAVIVGDEKFVLRPDGSKGLYDLSRDPLERHDLSAERPDAAARLEAMVREWIEKHPVDESGGARISPEREEALRQLGY